MTREVRISARARRDLAEAQTWWRANRDKPVEFLNEKFERAFELLATYPRMGERAEIRGVGEIRRHFVDGVRYFIYYRVADSFIEVLALWHSSRGTKPRL